MSVQAVSPKYLNRSGGTLTRKGRRQSSIQHTSIIHCGDKHVLTWIEIKLIDHDLMWLMQSAADPSGAGVNNCMMLIYSTVLHIIRHSFYIKSIHSVLGQIWVHLIYMGSLWGLVLISSIAWKLVRSLVFLWRQLFLSKLHHCWERKVHE